MKKFQFSLDKVLTYKEQIEEDLRNQHALIIQSINKEENILKAMEEEFAVKARELDEIKQRGCTIIDIQIYQGFLESMGEKIRKQIEVIKTLKIREEKKLAEVIEAKKETTTITKLKEKKVSEYSKLEQKAEEQFIEEFVSNARSGKDRSVS